MRLASVTPVALLLALSACERGPSVAHAASAQPATVPALPRDLNVLLITIDALRADMPWTAIRSRSRRT
jgi:hypothetical protein